jgi:glycosyltransferase involved in cell wall biosynthesis
MRVLQVFNHYRQPGGEAKVVQNEAELLRRQGHEVECLAAYNADLAHRGSALRVLVGLETTWSMHSYAEMKSAIQRFSPDIVHVHNTFPLLSPSIYWAAAHSRTPVVKTLHNYRLTCASAMLSRKDSPCEDCIGRLPLPALRYRCYHDSLPQTAAIVISSTAHKLFGTYGHKIHAYIVLTEFSRRIMLRAGLPAERLFVKPNFTFDRAPKCTRQPIVTFVGKISREKGVHLLLKAWRQVSAQKYGLVVVGDGPDRLFLENEYHSDASIIWAGAQSHEETMRHIARSRFLLLPSLVYEGMPMTLIEAFCCGTPVIVPDHGPFPELVLSGKNGWLFRAGDVESLVSTLAKALALSEDQWIHWSTEARDKYLTCFTESTNYEHLITIYRNAAETACHTRQLFCGTEQVDLGHTVD